VPEPLGVGGSYPDRYGVVVDVLRGRQRPDGEIVILGVDDVVLPQALKPSTDDVLLQADGTDHWLVVAAPPGDWVRFGAKVVRAVPDGTVGFRTAPSASQLRDFVRGWRLAGYRYGADSHDRKQLVVSRQAPNLDAVIAATTATIAARDLVNTPSNIKNPQWMVGQARAVGRAVGAEVEVLGVPQLRAGGFGGVLAVGAGSASPPRVVILRRPGSGPRVVLVGKGITFDSGGLSIKPRDAMMLMKTDMAGSAAVLSAMRLLPEGSDVTALLGFAENAVGASSYRPGDVITHVDGRTTEVRNTDAEGRLVLADLLAYARLNLQPDVMVDVATLTGAATMALSREMGAVLATSERLQRALIDAGVVTGERLWPLPLEPSYRSALESAIADQCHVPIAANVGAGAITAALFLQAFAGEVPWAHLDIAGPARATADAGVRQQGGTGFGAALIGRWLAAGARH
jgi:leucyl aminopeptidase